MRICVVMLALASCQGSSKPAPKAEPKADPAPMQPAPAEGGSSMDPGHCERQPFAESTSLPEASGAAWLPIDGKLSMVVVADSGHNGDYAVIDPDTGATRERGKLPLGKPGDDLEGLAAHDGKLFGLTSDGWMRVWLRKGSGFELVDGPYSIGSDADGTACTAKRKCPINYEGLALAASPDGDCVGFACSKGDGGVYCLIERDGRYQIDKARRIAVTKPGALGDCTFDDKDQLWAGDNIFGMDQVFRIDGWANPASAKVVPANALGVGFPEVVAVRGDVIYRMSDTGGPPSLMAKFRCLAPTR